jgi:hypothetical protein
VRPSYGNGPDAHASQDMCQPVSKCVTRDELEDDLHGGEEPLPSPFDSLDFVQDTGPTPLPRVHTLVEGDVQTSLGQELKVNEMGHDEDNPDNSVDSLNYTAIVITAPEDPASATKNARENDTRSIESYTSAFSSLTLDVCKICHCGEEVRKSGQFQTQRNYLICRMEGTA